LYHKKHYARGDNQDDELRAPEEERLASDMGNWKIDMPDGVGVEIDDIEEESVDDDSQPPRSRVRLT
jgi:hypothetical protein